jgi:hypothetical protein
MKIVLVLGCWGRKESGFVICDGVSNQILDLTDKTTRNIDISNYLDSHFKLFDRPIYSNVHTAIWNIQEKFSIRGKPVFGERIFRWMEEFCLMHAKCGLFLRLELIRKEE